MLDFRLLTKNKVFYLKLILFPSILILILGTVFSNASGEIKPYSIAFYNQDQGLSHGDQHNSLGKTLQENIFEQTEIKKIISLKEVSSYEQGKQMLQDGQVAVLISIPSNFTKAAMNNEKTSISLLGDNDKPLDKQVTSTILERFMGSVRTVAVEQKTLMELLNRKDKEDNGKDSRSKSGSNSNSDTNSNSDSKSDTNKGIKDQVEAKEMKIKIEQMMAQISGNHGLDLKIPKVSTNKSAVLIDAMQYYSIAMVVMFSIMTSFVLVHSIVDEKQNHTLFRIKSTPTLQIQYVLGKLSGIVFCVVIQMIIVIAISQFVFQMQWGNLFDLLLITVAYAFAIGSMVLLWGFIAKDHVAVSGLSSPVLYIFSFLGGSFIPKSGLPEGLRVVQEMIPNGKAINAYLQVSQGIGLKGIYVDLLELIGIGLLFMLLNIKVYGGKWGNTRAISNHGE